MVETHAGRADGRRQGAASTRPSRAAPYAGQTVVQQATASGYQWSPTAPASPRPNRSKPILGLFAPEQHGPRVDRPDCRRRTRHGRRRPARSNPARTGDRAAPVGHDRQGASSCSDQVRPGAAARASSCRSRAPRSTSRTTPRTRAARSVRRSSSTRPSRSRSTTSKQHPDTLVIVTADHGHTSQIVDGRHRPHTGRRSRR